MTSPQAAPPGERVPVSQWVAAVALLAEQGHVFLDLLTAVDRPDDGVIEIVVHVVTDDGQSAFAHTHIDRDSGTVPTITDVFPPAAWHEREIAEMFGVTIDGMADIQRLLLADSAAQTPLRKEIALVERDARPRPGGADTGRRSRRGAR